MKSRKRWIWLVAGIAVSISAVVAGWALRPRGPSFDPVAWRDEAQIERGVRLKMADRIIGAKMLSGKTRAQVVEMLGEPPPTGYFRTWDLVYWLGRERGYISIDSEWLVVRFDAAGNVSEYRLVRD